MHNNKTVERLLAAGVISVAAGLAGCGGGSSSDPTGVADCASPLNGTDLQQALTSLDTNLKAPDPTAYLDPDSLLDVHQALTCATADKALPFAGDIEEQVEMGARALSSVTGINLLAASVPELDLLTQSPLDGALQQNLMTTAVRQMNSVNYQLAASNVCSFGDFAADPQSCVTQWQDTYGNAFAEDAQYIAGVFAGYAEECQQGAEQCQAAIQGAGDQLGADLLANFVDASALIDQLPQGTGIGDYQKTLVQLLDIAANAANGEIPEEYRAVLDMVLGAMTTGSLQDMGAASIVLDPLLEQLAAGGLETPGFEMPGNQDPTAALGELMTGLESLGGGSSDFDPATLLAQLGDLQNVLTSLFGGDTSALTDALADLGSAGALSDLGDPDPGQLTDAVQTLLSELQGLQGSAPSFDQLPDEIAGPLTDLFNGMQSPL